ncbi:hypothetical protein F1559_000427 [Cyanidiococcus yangmingshanensis]|uniref:Uncharacterized protein n=1 Tax=Cyanidiococcus yangmingshanensis TaxID=2690220 RepID=A0A7J7ICP1_9RHOD|nr:hypothetical protein F1559_000427 [Cyanidiococcus yangmingshanensis]
MRRRQPSIVNDALPRQLPEHPLTPIPVRQLWETQLVDYQRRVATLERSEGGVWSATVGVQSKAQVVSASREGGTQTRSSRSTRQVAASRERAMSSTLRKVGVSAESTVDEHHASTGRNQPSSGRGTTAARLRTRKSDGTVQGSDRRGVRASGRELSDRAVDKASTWTPSRSSGNETDDDDDDDESSSSSVNASTTETTSRHGRARAAARVHGSEQDDQMLETPLSMEEKETRRLELENELVWLRQEAALLVQVAQMIPSIPNGELKSQLGVIETESCRSERTLCQ